MEQSRELRQLFDACAQGSVDAVNSLLDCGFDVNATDEDDVTALQIAAANGQEQVVRLLLVRGAAVDQANVTGWTPLLHAARNGHAAVAALLIQNHAGVDARTCYGAGVACLAARSGNLATCRLLEGAGVSFTAAPQSSVVSSVKSTLEITPLVVAAHRGHDSVIKLLMSSVDVNCPVKSTGVTALMAAAVGGYVSTTRLLVERGRADVDAVDINEKCALDYSIAQDKQQVKQYLETKTTRSLYPTLRHTEPGIIEAVKHGNVEQVKDILDRDVSQRDARVPHDGATPLMFSAMLGHLHLVKLLVENGCNINAQDVVSGWTALMQAIFHGRKEVAVYLIKAGADVTVPAKSGCTAFDMASIIGDVDTELYRLIAARAMPVDVTQQVGISAGSHLSSADAVNRVRKSGVKAWWSRVSKRFHNLKQRENISSDVYELDEVVNDATLRNNMSSTRRLPTNDALLKSITTNPLTGVFDVGADTTVQTVKHTATLSHDIMTGAGSTAVRSVVLPVFPSPSFHTNRTSRMPPASLRKPLSSQNCSRTLLQTRPAVSSGIKLPPKQHWTLNLLNGVASPPPRVQFAKRPIVKRPLVQTDVSPSSSGDAGMLGGSDNTAAAAAALPASAATVSSTSSSTLTAGSDVTGKTPPSVEQLQSKRCRKSRHNRVDRNSNDSQPGPLFHSKLHDLDAANNVNVPLVEKDSGFGTGVLHQEKTADQYRNLPSVCDQTDLGGLLQELSLECYQPIFEEQEVDMEAFLTLTDGDLNELGIESRESRRQILAAVSELNANKDRQRLLYHKAAMNTSTGVQPQRMNVK